MSTDEALYAGHWGKVYAEDASQHRREWQRCRERSDVDGDI